MTLASLPTSSQHHLLPGPRGLLRGPVPVSARPVCPGPQLMGGGWGPLTPAAQPQVGPPLTLSSSFWARKESSTYPLLVEMSSATTCGRGHSCAGSAERSPPFPTDCGRSEDYPAPHPVRSTAPASASLSSSQQDPQSQARAGTGLKGGWAGRGGLTVMVDLPAFRPNFSSSGRVTFFWATIWGSGRPGRGWLLPPGDPSPCLLTPVARQPPSTALSPTLGRLMPLCPCGRHLLCRTPSFPSSPAPSPLYQRRN